MVWGTSSSEEFLKISHLDLIWTEIKSEKPPQISIELQILLLSQIWMENLNQLNPGQGPT